MSTKKELKSAKINLKTVNLPKIQNENDKSHGKQRSDNKTTTSLLQNSNHSKNKTQQQQQQPQQQQQNQQIVKVNNGKATPTKLNRNQVSANWSSLSITIRPQISISPSKKIGFLSKFNVIALDCEMVGIGPNGRDHMLARVSIVSDNGDIILDKYVKPTQPVVDYRTKYSGITPDHLENAHTFAEVQAEVIRLKTNRIVVGHALHNDFKVLKVEHPKRLIRDTSMYRKCREFSSGSTPALRLLTNCILNYDIQAAAHCSIEDARAAMEIYQKFAKHWERAMAKYF